jgi:DNA-binding transcriptional LysR family regulator
MDRTDHIGRRLRLRDLQLLDAVVRWGSIARAASQLNLTQSAASKAIAQLEHAIGVSLLDRNARGVEPTLYGQALIRRGLAIFDELRQGVKEIEFLADPSVGEVRVGCPEASAAGLLPAVVQKLGQEHPGIVCDAVWMPPAVPLQYRELRERRIDLVLGRVIEPEADDDLQVEILFHDPVRVVVGHRSKWVRRRKIALSELVGEPWILTPPESVPSSLLVEAFRSMGLDAPRASVVSTSIHIANRLLPTGRYVTALPESVLRFGAMGAKITALPVEFPSRPRPMAIVKLRNRTLSPAANLFIEAARRVSMPLARATQYLVR